MKRPLLPTVEQVCEGKRRVVVIDGVVDSTNVAAIFRSAAALGIEAVLLTRNSCDPLLRRSARVSMGSVFLVPWAWLDGPVQSLNSLGFKTVAMALTDKSISLMTLVSRQSPVWPLLWGQRATAFRKRPYRGLTTWCEYQCPTVWIRSTWLLRRLWHFGFWAIAVIDTKQVMVDFAPLSH